jgi:serine/threonine-protein kinase
VIGQLVGDRYRVLRKIGEGGMGEVYLAEHIYIEKKVALKLLRAEVLSNQEAVARFRQEARSASSIGHDNIIQIDDFGMLPDGRVYMAMEFLQGLALNDLIVQQPLQLPRALDIMIQVGKGLAAAHAKGITHRDMKPENIFVTNKEGRDVPKILDFGIAKVNAGDGAQNLTVAGTIFGTPFYMAPEQAMGGKMDHRVDIYAMGIILYEVFCGQVPFKADSFMGILTQHITSPPMPPAQMAAQHGRVLPPGLEAIINKAIRKDPNERYQSMNELVAAMIELYRFTVGTNPSGYVAVPGGGGGPTPSRRWALYAGIGGVVAVGGIALAIIGGGSSTPAARPDAPAHKVVVVDAPPAPRPPDAPARAATPPDAAPTAVAPPDARPATAGTDVKVTSTPSGAAVFVDGKRRCTTPCTVHAEIGARIVLSAADHDKSTFVVTDGMSSKFVRLLASGLHPE